MARRPDPARIATAHRAGIAARLADTGIPRDQAERLLDLWAGEHGPLTWDGAFDWALATSDQRRAIDVRLPDQRQS